jgi:hypothetical protein
MFYMTAFDKFKNQNWECDFRTHPKKSPLCGIFIESRPHPDIEYALRNFSCMFPYASLTILHSNRNYEQIQKIVGYGNNIRFIVLPEPYGRMDYVKGNLSPEFWDPFLDYDRVLMFFNDSGVRHNSILKFMNYDFIGAHWNHLPTGDPRVFQGNGGFSLRNPRLMKEINVRWPCPNPDIGEDVWFNHHLVHGIPGSVLPTKETCAEFSTEGNDIGGTMGFHDSERYTPGAWRMYEVADGPGRKLVDVRSADVDGRDVTTLIRLGIGPNGLRVFKETHLGPGQTLTIRTDSGEFSYEIQEGHLRDNIYIV